MAKEVVIDGELAAQARRLIGARSAREAAETVLREFVRNGAGRSRRKSAAAATETDEDQQAQIARQHERIFESSLAVARRGSPFYPGFNHKDLRKNRDAAKDGEGGESSEDQRAQIARQHERIRKTALAAARSGHSFPPGFNPKKLWKPRDFGRLVGGH